ncbi:MAG: FtsX-like permease family protein [Olsenella sp.]|nr:FtsX-like permease family protein [Olsenella sp.]
MKSTRIAEILVNIKVNLVAFLSIAMFVGLGIAVFLGIQWGSFALENAVQQAFDRGNMHDIEVLFPYGLTDDDLARLKSVDGVTDVEPGYVTFAKVGKADDADVNGRTLKVQSMPERIDTFLSVEGSLPTKPNEVALLKNWVPKGIGIGDTIVVKRGSADGAENLKVDSFTVTALVVTPAYLGNSTYALGVANTSSGIVDCVGYVPRDAFDTSKFHDGYPSVNLRCASLEGKPTFSDDYSATVKPIVDAVTELGGTLATARYDKLHAEAQDQIDSAEAKIADGEKDLEGLREMLVDGEQTLESSRQMVADGEKTLVDTKMYLADQQSLGAEQLAEAYRTLAEGQAKYDVGVSQYNVASELYNQVSEKFEGIRGSYDEMVASYYALEGHYDSLVARYNAFESALARYDAAPEVGRESLWPDVEASYEALRGERSYALDSLEPLADVVSNVVVGLGTGVSLPSMPSFNDTITPETRGSALQAARDWVEATDGFLRRIADTQISVSGTTISLLDVPGGLAVLSEQLDASRETLESGAALLDEGWDAYYAGKALYDEKIADGKSQIGAGQQRLDDARGQIASGERDLAEGKDILRDKSAELRDGKKALGDAKKKFEKMDRYEWVVVPRQDGMSALIVTTMTKMMGSARWAMASLFVLVGLFVCYSAIARLVHEQITQIGTKKAIGFRQGEIAFGYLVFSGLAVLVGIIVGALLAVFLVQVVMNPTANRQFSIPEYPPFFGPLDLALMGGLELVLILGATWLAIRGILKRQAVELLKGETKTRAHERFYERTALWRHMSLYSQTIVNNCVNDVRRVAGTLVGVIGCTALIVTAVTLADNVARSLEQHYDKVYSYDTIAYLSAGDRDARSAASMALFDAGVSGTPTSFTKLQVRKPDGKRAIATLVVPMDEETFGKFCHVLSHEDGTERPRGDGLWISASYAEHLGVHVGDTVTTVEGSGRTRDLKVSGVFDSYLMRFEFVMGQEAYVDAFGKTPEPNALLVDRDGGDIDVLRKAVADSEGIDSIFDDRKDAEYGFGQLSSLLNVVVAIYLALSALMALMVLLNLYTMFVDEKKRELIVLMINGYSVDEAKAYIYRDSILLTIVGIVFGLVLGTFMGIVTTTALEPEMGFFLKEFSWIAAIAGVVGTSAFSAGVLLFALRRIPRFDLTDINRF